MTVSVRTSWTVTSGCIASLPQTVSCLSQCSLDSVTSPESCVLLTRGDSQDRGELSLQTSPGQAVTGVFLASSCPRWEVVAGVHYIDTLQGVKQDLGEEEEEESDIVVFTASLVFSQGHEKVTLRLPPGLTESCWIFSLQTTLASCLPSPALGHFSLSRVDSLLCSSSLPLSDRAKQFRSLFESFQSSGPPPLAPPQHLPVEGGGDTAGHASGDGPDGHGTGLSSPGLNTGTILLLQNYIDKKFTELEDRLVKRIEEAALTHNHKLDSIIAMLRSSEPLPNNG